jgi:hypothetical protein
MEKIDRERMVEASHSYWHKENGKNLARTHSKTTLAKTTLGKTIISIMISNIIINKMQHLAYWPLE